MRATKHDHATNIQSFQPGENGRWCSIDQTMIQSASFSLARGSAVMALPVKWL